MYVVWTSLQYKGKGQLFGRMQVTVQMKGTEVPNPRRSSACDCTCVLIDHCLVTLSCLPCAFFFVPAYAQFAQRFQSLMLAMRILFCSCLCKIRSQISDDLSQALCNLPLAFLADFTLSDSTALTCFIAFLHSAFRLDRKT